MSVADLLSTATTGGDPPTDLELYLYTLPAGPLPADADPPSSRIYSGEATAFYVATGTVTFVVGSDVAPGTVRLVASSEATPSAATEGEHAVAAGGALFVDAQNQNVTVVYRNDESEAATLVITSAVPCVSMSASPTPG